MKSREVNYYFKMEKENRKEADVSKIQQSDWRKMLMRGWKNKKLRVFLSTFKNDWPFPLWCLSLWCVSDSNIPLLLSALSGSYGVSLSFESSLLPQSMINWIMSCLTCCNMLWFKRGRHRGVYFLKTLTVLKILLFASPHIRTSVECISYIWAITLFT